MRSLGWRTKKNGPRRVRGACSYCGTVWESNKLWIDGDGNYVCPLEGRGRSRATLDTANIEAQGLLQESPPEYHGPVFDENLDPEPVHHETREDVTGWP